MMIFCAKIARVFLAASAGLLASSIAYGEVYDMPPPGEDVVGEITEVKSHAGDTLLTIANKYDIGMHEMLEANPHLRLTEESASRPMGAGKKVIVPTQFVLPSYRKGIVINLPELRLYYFTPDSRYVYTYPVGLGRMEWRTPLGKGVVTNKEVDPTWHVPPSIHAHVLKTTGVNLPASVPPGPENPLGKHAMRLSIPGYLIHGTNQPWSIGKYISSGCIRLHNEDVAELFEEVQVGTPVRIINYAQKAGWRAGQLYLESQHRLSVQAPVGELNEGSPNAVVASKARDAQVDEESVNRVLEESSGIPQAVGGFPTVGALDAE